MVVILLFAGTSNCLQFLKVLEKKIMLYSKEDRVVQENVVAVDSTVND